MADAVGPVFTERGVEPLGALRLRQPETLLDIEPPLRGAPTHQLGEPGLQHGTDQQKRQSRGDRLQGVLLSLPRLPHRRARLAL